MPQQRMVFFFFPFTQPLCPLSRVIDLSCQEGVEGGWDGSKGDSR